MVDGSDIWAGLTLGFGPAGHPAHLSSVTPAKAGAHRPAYSTDREHAARWMPERARQDGEEVRLFDASRGTQGWRDADVIHIDGVPPGTRGASSIPLYAAILDPRLRGGTARVPVDVTLYL